MNKASELPPVYSFFWHKEHTWRDIILSIIIYFIVPIGRFIAPNVLGLEEDDKEKNRKLLQEANIRHAEKLRSGLLKLIDFSLKHPKNGTFYVWAATAGCDIVTATIKIPRQDNLFLDWEILSDAREQEELEYSLPNDSDIVAHVSFPVTILPMNIQVPTQKNDYGCLVLDDEHILDHLPNNIPTVIFFHSGGMTMGTHNAMENLELMVKCLQSSCSEKEKPKPFIFATVEYSLAPEHPFPAAPLEACSVVSHFLSQYDFPLHISGISAGSNLALVSGIEAYRHAHKVNNKTKKSKIKSVTAFCPMLSPAADSLSFYQNSRSSIVTPVHFLRWCYQVYLELPPATFCEDEEKEVEVDEKNSDDSPRSIALSRNSNKTAWHQSKWRKSELRRLAEPIVADLPIGFFNKDDSPKFIFSTNTADPLHDDGIVMIKMLRNAGASVSHHDHKGSHWIGTRTNNMAYSSLGIAVTNLIFDVKDDDDDDVTS